MRHFLFIVFFLIGGIYLLVQCSSNGNGEVSEVDQAKNDASKITFPEITDRIGEIAKCAKCHQKEYENWLAGPHANAYKSLMKHSAHVAANGSFSNDYKQFVETKLDAICLACHTGKNLYESNYLGLQSENDYSKYTEEYFPHIFDQIQERDKKKLKNLSTGVDCMTCHSYGKKIVTNQSSTAKSVKESCELIKSKFFESNQNCFACHHHQVETMQRLVKEKKMTSEENCVSCHQQYDEQGKGTHYFYWREESAEIIRPDRLNIFKSIQAKLTSEGNQYFVEVNWQNDFLPHDFSECGEIVLMIEVFNKFGKKEGSGEIRINRKDKMKSLPANHFKEGQIGNEFIYGGKPASVKLNVSSNVAGGKVKILGSVKPQYWSSEEELKKVFEKELEF